MTRTSDFDREQFFATDKPSIGNSYRKPSIDSKSSLEIEEEEIMAPIDDEDNTAIAYINQRNISNDPIHYENDELEAEVEAEIEEGGKGILADIFEGLGESPYQGIGAIADLSNQVFNSMGYKSVQEYILSRFNLTGESKEGDFKPEGPLGRFVSGGDLFDTTDPAESTTGGIIRVGTQFLAGFLPVLGQISKLTKTWGFFKNSKRIKAFLDTSLAGAPVDAFGFDPSLDNVANLTAKIFSDSEAAQVLEDYLGTDPNDSEALNRFRNALQGVILGAAFEGVFLGVRGVKGYVDKISKEIQKQRNTVAADELVARATETGKTAPEGSTTKIEVDGKSSTVKGEKVDVEDPTAQLIDDAEIEKLAQETTAKAKSPNDVAQKIIDNEKLSVETAEANTRFELKGGKKVPKVKRTPEEKAKLAGEVDEAIKKPEKGAKVSTKDKKLHSAKMRALTKALRDGDTVKTTELLDFNIKNMETNEGLDEILNTTTEMFRPMAKDIPVTHEMVKDQAAVMGISEVKLQEIYKNVVTEDLSAKMLATRHMLLASADDVAKQVARAAGSDSGEAVIIMNRAITRHVAIQNTFSGIKTEIARTLNSFKILADGADARLGAMDSFVSAMGGRSLNRKYAQRLLAILDNVGENGMTRASLKRFSEALKKTPLQKTKDALLEMYINGLLSKPVTQVVNAMGNASTIAISVAERYTAELAGKGIAGGVAKGETAAMLNGLYKGLFRGWQLGAKAWRTDTPSDFMTKTDSVLPFRRAISAERFELDGWLGAFTDFIGTTTRLPGRLLMSTDEFFKTINYDMNLHALAYRKARSVGEPQGKEFVDVYSEVVAGLDLKINAESLKAARYQTFTNDIGSATISGRLNSIIDHPNAWGLPRVFIPFFRTPLNILKFVGHRTPIARNFSDTIKSELASPDLAIRQLAKAKLATGTSLYTSGIMLAAGGLLTGASPSDPLTRRNRLASGWRPYSISTPWGYFPYNRFDPIGIMLGMSADLYQGFSLAAQTVSDIREGDGEYFGDEAMDKYLEAGGIAISGIYKSLEDRHYVAGLATIFEMIHGDEGAWKRAFAQQFLTAVPPFSFYSSFRKGVRDTIDPIKRNKDAVGFWGEFSNVIQNELPLATEHLAPQFNILGEPKLRMGSEASMAWRAFNTNVNPFKGSSITKSHLEYEISRLEIPIGDVATLRRIGPASVIKGGIKMPQTEIKPEEKVYFAKVFGDLNKILDKNVKTKEFQKLSDEDKIVEIRYTMGINRAAALKSTIGRFPDIAIRSNEERIKQEQKNPPLISGLRPPT